MFVLQDQSEERDALKERYRLAQDMAKAANCEKLLRQFERALEKSKVVVQCSSRNLERLAASSRELLGNYYATLGLSSHSRQVPGTSIEE